jgi:uncharacterized membrane protein YqhA
VTVIFINRDKPIANEEHVVHFKSINMPNNTPEKRPTLADRLEGLFSLKYLALIVSFLLMVCGILAIILGGVFLVESIAIMIGLHEGKPGINMIESVDTFLFALVILILSGGIFKLFVGDENTLKNSIVFANIKSFKDLKVLLWETILLTLTVWCSLAFFLSPEKLYYEILIFPVTIVLLALALKFLRGNHHH